MEKVCAKCGHKKDESKFHKHSRMSDGLQPYCKECGKEYARKKRKEKELEKIRKQAESKKKYESDEKRKCLICDNIKEKEKFSPSEYNANGGQRCRKCMSKRIKENEIKRIQRGDI